MADNRIDLDGAAAVLDYEFTDRELGSIALQPSRLGFSRLEFVGDAILGLVVFTLAECADAPRPLASELVSNDMLDELFLSTFAEFSRANTGDVIEALIGAVYLDGGFDRAANAVTTAVVPRFGSFDSRAIADHSRDLSSRGLMYLGANTSKAVVADHLCRTQPERNHRWYSEERGKFLRTARLAEIARSKGFCSPDLRGDPRKDATATDTIDKHIGELFLSRGWDEAGPEIAGVLDL